MTAKLHKNGYCATSTTRNLTARLRLLVLRILVRFYFRCFPVSRNHRRLHPGDSIRSQRGPKILPRGLPLLSRRRALKRNRRTELTVLLIPATHFRYLSNYVCEFGDRRASLQEGRGSAKSLSCFHQDLGPAEIPSSGIRGRYLGLNEQYLRTRFAATCRQYGKLQKSV